MNKFNLTDWVIKTECFSTNDLNNLEIAHNIIKSEYDYLNEKDFDNNFNMKKINNEIIIEYKDNDELKEELAETLRCVWEEENDQEDNDLVAEVTIEMLDL